MRDIHGPAMQVVEARASVGRYLNERLLFVRIEYLNDLNNAKLLQDVMMELFVMRLILMRV